MNRTTLNANFSLNNQITNLTLHILHSAKLEDKIVQAM